mgnify:CR=1 FL=1
MGLRTLQFDGRLYEYKIQDPTESEVKAKAQELMSKMNFGAQGTQITSGAAYKQAREELTKKYFEEAQTKVIGALENAYKKLNESKAEPGISQRRLEKIDLKELSGGVITRQIGGNAHFDDQVVLNEDEAKKRPDDLVNILNNELYRIRQRREAGVETAGIAKNSQTVDLKIPTPFSELSTREKFHDVALYLGGVGDAGSQFAQEMSRLNRFGKAFIAGSRELTGFTFITRPRCNLCQANLANVRQFAPLLFCDNQSTSHMIRMLLDTKLAATLSGERPTELFDPHNPFLVPACNALQSINGFPDPNLAVETTEGGFFSEAQTCVIGYDRLAHGTELQLSFKDYPGGPVMALHQAWVDYMGFLGDGTMSQYLEDIEHNIMGYTVSIYRFIMDPTGRQITRWAKATGCFPKMNPSGSIFNVNQGEHVVNAVKEFSLSYWAHHFGHYNDPIILKEFNMLVERYNSWIQKDDKGNVTNAIIAPRSINNRAGIPYITQKNGFTELVWLLDQKGEPERKPVEGESPHPNQTQFQKDIASRLEQNAKSFYGG